MWVVTVYIEYSEDIGNEMRLILIHSHDISFTFLCKIRSCCALLILMKSHISQCSIKLSGGVHIVETHRYIKVALRAIV